MSDQCNDVQVYCVEDPDNLTGRFKAIKIRMPDNFFMIDARLMDTELMEQLKRRIHAGITARDGEPKDE